MISDGLLEALQEHIQNHGRMKVLVDLGGTFIDVTHTDVVVMRDSEGNTPVMFINLNEDQVGEWLRSRLPQQSQ